MRDDKKLAWRFWAAIAVGVALFALACGWSTYSSRLDEYNEGYEQTTSEQNHTKQPNLVITNIWGMVFAPNQAASAIFRDQTH
jgi:hypothetical protein